MKTVCDVSELCLIILKETINRSFREPTDKALTGCNMVAYAHEYIMPYIGGGSVTSSIDVYRSFC